MAEDPQDALLAVAREIISNRGYLGLSLRTAAAAAGITPEVARRYYRNRDSLFAAALKLPVDPTTAIPTLVAPGLEGMGERLVRFMLDILKDPEARREIVSLARTGVNAGHALAGLQDFLERGVVDRIAGMIGVPDARMRSALITSYLLGIAMTRYGVRLEPLASASEEEVIRMVAPVIQDLLDPRKPIPGSARARNRSDEQRAGTDAGVPTPRVRTFDPDPKARAAAARAAATGPAAAPVASPGTAPARPPAARGGPAGGATAPAAAPGSAGSTRAGSARVPSERPATAKGSSTSAAGKSPQAKPAPAHGSTSPAASRPATAKPATARPATAKPATAKPTRTAKPVGAEPTARKVATGPATAPPKPGSEPSSAPRRSGAPSDASGSGTRADAD